MLETPLSSYDGQTDEDDKKGNSEMRGLFLEVRQDLVLREGQRNYYEKEDCLLQNTVQFFRYCCVEVHSSHR